MLKIRRPLGRLIFNMGIAIPGKTVFLIETAPCCSPPKWINDLSVGTEHPCTPASDGPWIFRGNLWHLPWTCHELDTTEKCMLIILDTVPLHDDVIKWKHFPRYWLFVRGIHRSRWIPYKRPVTRCFDVFFDLHLNKQLSKQSQGWWFETESCS